MALNKIGVMVLTLVLALAVVVSLLKVESDARDAFLCAAYHSDPALDPSKCPVHSSNLSWYFTLLYAGLVVVAILGAYQIVGRKENILKEKNAPRVDVSKLDAEEKQIYDLLQQQEGSRYQSDLIQETGFSKVHMTRILDRLEGKKVLERKRRGMTNVVILR